MKGAGMNRRDFIKGIGVLIASALIPEPIKRELQTVKHRAAWTQHFGKVVGYSEPHIAEVKRMVFKSGWMGSNGRISGSWSGFVEDDCEPYSVVVLPQVPVGTMVAFHEVGSRCGIAMLAGPV